MAAFACILAVFYGTVMCTRRPAKYRSENPFLSAIDTEVLSVTQRSEFVRHLSRPAMILYGHFFVAVIYSGEQCQSCPLCFKARHLCGASYPSFADWGGLRHLSRTADQHDTRPRSIYPFSFSRVDVSWRRRCKTCPSLRTLDSWVAVFRSRVFRSNHEWRSS